ncbi:acyl-CoA carboxylase subunit epsilon [Microbacterium sp. LRZ72]|uniref:acyl-CoA carboxylase subunit epsilon n=1 Tax=Microbacterium sp. LRZ72 TaxID=2942481 RepID=UPI0029A61319|nr:acyl-CoA carboxylase subunit epsilon [Microbacterium sp. LRZ72]MDX2377000.1 acyl-CoA carboxylase subunit epsilon [Microbacterium sp. LRZ72]
MSDEPDHSPSIDVRRGAPSEDELAALIAVVTEAYTVEADSAVADDAPTMSAWQRSARGLRAPLPQGSVWGRFEG